MTDLNPETRKQAFEIAARYASEFQCTMYIHRSTDNRHSRIVYHIGPESRIPRATQVARVLSW